MMIKEGESVSGENRQSMTIKGAKRSVQKAIEILTLTDKFGFDFMGAGQKPFSRKYQ